MTQLLRIKRRRKFILQINTLQHFINWINKNRLSFTRQGSKSSCQYSITISRKYHSSLTSTLIFVYVAQLWDHGNKSKYLLVASKWVYFSGLETDQGYITWETIFIVNQKILILKHLSFKPSTQFQKINMKQSTLVLMIPISSI